jgi:hypothetical protein
MPASRELFAIYLPGARDDRLLRSASGSAGADTRADI